MIDDSLSDTQQEKKMSVKELKLKYNTNELYAKKLEENGKIAIAVNGKTIVLDRSQAHLLMLYLQEHLNFGAQVLKPVEPKDDLLKGYYHCGCGMRHPKDFVCEKLK